MDDRAAQDQEVVRAVLKGDRNAFGSLVARHQKLVASAAWRYGVRQEEIEEVLMRYARIALREHAAAGYAVGVREFFET